MDFFLYILPNLLILAIVFLIALNLTSDRRAIKTNQQTIISLQKEVIPTLYDLGEKQKEAIERLNEIEAFLKIKKNKSS